MRGPSSGSDKIHPASGRAAGLAGFRPEIPSPLAGEGAHEGDQNGTSRDAGDYHFHRPLPPFSFLLAFLLSFLFSCAPPSRLPQGIGSGFIEKVPFYPQEAYQCGPASLAGVLNYWGVKVSPGDIAAEIFSPRARGTLDIDMVLYARKMGLKATKYRGSWEDLRKNIDSRHPLIVLVDEGFWVYQKNHFMVVVGYEDSVLIVNSGKEKHRSIGRDTFLKTWERTRFWTLRIVPK